MTFDAEQRLAHLPRARIVRLTDPLPGTPKALARMRELARHP
ncbi:hypothetical protein [Paraburkholderia sp. J10-1]|nr:hypothetical protein [Paraburkholderia sp. J10-1]